MDRRAQEQRELKRQAIVDMERARAALSHHSGRASAEFSPVAVLKRSFHRHRLAWVIGGAVAGLVVAGKILAARAGRKEEDDGGETRAHRSLSQVLTGSLFAAARKAAIAYAGKFVQDYIKHRIHPTQPDHADEHSVNP